eukprot:TRINITY_DN4136_c0_g1_i1.p1 TRINITY_DN4136_c0_g1~~TRINITY_DN4136_c0_g1_i1.p1  ORF type:complete len:285 (-),score=36.08 TRINITY_DN4136_c0_g1_i1:4-858(-)
MAAMFSTKAKDSKLKKKKRGRTTHMIQLCWRYKQQILIFILITIIFYQGFALNEQERIYNRYRRDTYSQSNRYVTWTDYFHSLASNFVLCLLTLLLLGLIYLVYKVYQYFTGDAVPKHVLRKPIPTCYSKDRLESWVSEVKSIFKSSGMDPEEANEIITTKLAIDDIREKYINMVYQNPITISSIVGILNHLVLMTESVIFKEDHLESLINNRLPPNYDETDLENYIRTIFYNLERKIGRPEDFDIIAQGEILRNLPDELFEKASLFHTLDGLIQFLKLSINER